MGRDVSGIEELRRFTKPLNEYDIRYWANDGTALGLIREGRLLENDPDIDVGIWASEELIFKKALEEYKNDYEIKSICLNDTVFAYSLTPHDGGRDVNIKLFWSDDKYAYSIAPYRNRTISGDPPEIQWCIEYFQKRLGKIYRYVYKKRTGSKTLTTPFWSFKKSRVWKIPLRFLEELDFSEEFYTYLPSEIDSFLKYRYGDWRIPEDDWDTWEDDGGIIDEDPDNIPVIPVSKKKKYLKRK